MPSSGPLWQLMKYGLVGIVNTLITAVVIFLLMHLGLGIYLSNAMGYVVGIVFSFIANTIFTFTQPISINRLIKFLCVCFICYVANIIVIKIFFVFMPEKIYSAQILGMFTYTITGFIL
ncbi:GtrA family protein, partial [Klebsiella pneumoniae]|nr:GtrA family protein [Klebsiella pneumoniae]EMD1946204.1 GtrA family protein [Klebsiella pneumoniae]